MSRFIVKKGNTLKHDGVIYAEGETVELTYEQAKEMPHCVELAPPPKSASRS